MATAHVAAATDPGADALVPYRIVADGIPEPLATGDAARGKALLTARDPANCVLCHAVPDASIPFAGNVGPPSNPLTVHQRRLTDVSRMPGSAGGWEKWPERFDRMLHARLNGLAPSP